MSDISRLKEAGEVPTDVAIAAARADRHAAWMPIRGAYLAEDTGAVASIPVVQRREAVSTLERRISEADQLADRKSVEAQRITDLAAAEKQSVDATAAVRSATAAKVEIEAKVERLRREFAETWPEAAAKADDLSRLKAFVTERLEILERAEEVEKVQGEVDRLRADHDPRIELLVLAEQRLKIVAAPTGTLQARIQTLTREIETHDDAYASYRTDAAASEQISDQLRRKRDNLAALEKAQAEWLAEWRSAVPEIGLKDDVSPERANELVNEWSAARGVLEAVKSTKKRLSQFDDDERTLNELIAGIARTFDFVLPRDPVAAAKMLDERLNAARKTETQKASLAPQLTHLANDRDRKARALASREAAVAARCAEAGADETSVIATAERHEQFIAAKATRERIVSTILTAGDGRAVEVLREEWGGPDLDGVRADVSQIREETSRIGTEMEGALTNLQDRRRDLKPFEAEAGINEAVADRERAAAEMHRAVDRYMEVTLARALLETAVSRLRSEQQNPLLVRAGELFALTTRGAFSGIGTDVDENGIPVVIGRRPAGRDVAIDRMSDGARDQLFLAFRLASIEHYCSAAEPLPFIADDLLVHFDDKRGAATLDLLAEVGKTTQVLLFTHHNSVREAAAVLAERGEAGIIDLT